MNTYWKFLVVLITVTSLGFTAFTMALVGGGPDWQGEFNAPEMRRDVVFTPEQGEKMTYTAKFRRDNSPIVDKSPNIAEVVVKSRKRLEDDANKTLQELSPIPQQLEDGIKGLSELIPIDRAGAEAREKQYTDRLLEIWGEIQTIGSDYSALALQAQAVMRVSEERRGEIYRLMNQLELIRNDKFAAMEQLRFLEDERTRLEENQRRLERRQNQLKKELY